MPLTVAERSHWRDRIAAKIERRIETLVAKQDPTLLQRVKEAAHAKAYESLGIAAQEDELEALERQTEEIRKRQTRLRAEQRAAISGRTVEEEMERSCCYSRDQEIAHAVDARAKALESDLLAESQTGRQVLTLREEKDNLLDTVWLATSSSQIKELWAQVNELLEAKPTALEDKALKIAPVEDSGG